MPGLYFSTKMLGSSTTTYKESTKLSRAGTLDIFSLKSKNGTVIKAVCQTGRNNLEERIFVI
jgi:hypothetical protein